MNELTEKSLQTDEKSLQTDENNLKPVDYGAKLRPKVRKFVLEYVKSGNATQSAIKAGYSENKARNQGWRLGTNEDVRSFITQLQQEAEEEHKAIFGSVIQRTNEITRIAERGKLQTNSKGDPVLVKGEPVYVKDTANALKGLEQLSKLGGLYDKNTGKPDDRQPWTGIEIDYGDGTLRVVTGTGPAPTQAVQKTAEEGPPENVER